MLRHNPLSVLEHTLCVVLGCCSFCVLHDIAMHMKIRGLSFSWKRAVGITAAKQKISRKTGLPTTRQGLERKIGRFVLNSILGNKKK